MSRKLRLLAGYVKGLPIWCSWQVTPRCASFCAFCEHRAEGAFEELELAGIRRVSEELGTAGALMVSLSGGDPLLREDLPEVVRAVARHHFPLVTTHGFHVTRERARALWESGLEAATVTLDHADAVRQDAAAGMPGSHGRALLALAAFAATRTRAGQQVNVKTRLRAETLEGLDDLLKLAAEQGASVTVEPAYPLPAGLEGIKQRLRDLRSRRSNLRIGPFFLDHIEQALAGGVPGCQAGKAFFNVDERGRVSKCVEFRRPEDRAGDLSREPLSDVFPRLRRIHQANDCRACWMASRGEVEGLYTVRGLLQALPALVRA
ncbi:MAG TPA: radical SAM protein [Vicinamibacteria bacterium]